MAVHLRVVNGGGAVFDSVWAARRPPGSFRWLLEKHVRAVEIRPAMDRLLPRAEAPSFPRRTKAQLLDLFFAHWPDDDDYTWEVIGQQMEFTCELSRGSGGLGWGWERLEAPFMQLPKEDLVEAARELGYIDAQTATKQQIFRALRREDIADVVWVLPERSRLWLAERTGRWRPWEEEHDCFIQAYLVAGTSRHD